jgi:hypothetical protein
LHIRGDQEGKVDQQKAEEQKDQSDAVTPTGIGDQTPEQAQDLLPVEDEVDNQQG